MITRRDTLLAAMAAASFGDQVRGATAISTPAIERDYVGCRFGQLHVRRCGTATKRPPLLFFHQVPNSGQVFTAVLPALGRDRRVFAIDTPGYGMSDPAPDPQTILAYADAMADGVRALGLRGPIDLIGYHTGAAIAAALAGRAEVAVRRVMLVAIPVFDEAQRASMGALTPIPFDEGGDWAREEWRRSWHWRGPGQTRDSVLRSFAEKMRFGARERGAQAIAAFDMASALTAIRQPLMLVRPKDDLWEASARARSLRGDAVYAELSEFGHGLWDAAPDRMVELIRDFFDS